ncbi:acetyl-CoA carboxylase biotin carboxyl carrier protein [Pararhizobium mangrovi]|uniref:Biotin carboxyl carrier protein of acetyl-CoA carboxylase n=1 Tax=Pararhizobium mangrovi TaxID=2590452 RepID=A0A506UBB8_9HYPH|nr:acetyl-CoA carboxylase biotin carboxyl carrier protein [Pararhizobium mangrovi]TPW31230.1 acetyl-CoA carboxylase biotin carboxyl carrier protein [Pararhizobium mangrovi]
MAIKKNGVDQQLIRDLANILTETDLTEIEIEQEELRIRVSRNGTVQTVQATAAMPGAMPVSPPALAATEAAADTPAPVPANTVNSPMVGTAYLAASPGARPFVEVGQTIREGQTVMIVEAMKTMNQIPSPQGGKVVEILVEDGQPVEYGEPLIVLE